MQDEFLSVKEFAAKVRIHVNTVYRAINAGRLNAFRIGSGSKSMLRIPQSEISRLAEKDMFDRHLR